MFFRQDCGVEAGISVGAGICLCKKFEIANYPENNLLNKQTEIIANF